MHSDAIRVLSSVFTIAQRDTRNKEYLISWLKNKPGIASFWVKYFFQASSI